VTRSRLDAPARLRDQNRTENLAADSFGRDYHITAELAGKKDGTLTSLRFKTIADHGYTDAATQPSKFPAGLFHICTGSYDFKSAFVTMALHNHSGASPIAVHSATGRPCHRA
jgi:carbon-monoxide dehydrogenase large subunit